MSRHESMARLDEIMRGLTAAQRQAVEHFEGPLLVLAGPGSGKTRVITTRIARLRQRGVAPHEILAITFTNKAAREMAERVSALVPSSRLWVTTFHKFCARLIREHADRIGLKPNFTIFDQDEQRSLVKRLLGEADVDTTRYNPRSVAAHISRLKNRGVDAGEFARRYSEIRQTSNPTLDVVTARVWPAYQQALLGSNAVDFDDLLVFVASMLEEHPELRAELDARFRFVLVDEYQDTNAAQYRIVKLLSVDHPNLCATGDPDQSIYGWRGAEIKNILDFERDFPTAAVVRLEENFRSTASVLSTADALIANNKRRKQKSLIATKPPGAPVRLLQYDDGEHEANEIARCIAREAAAGRRAYRDFAVLFRINAMTRQLEAALLREGVPYQIAAGTAFFERAVVKDLLAWMRLILNPADEAAFLRAVNVPPRGLGAKSISRLQQWADRARCTLFEAALEAARIPDLQTRAQAAFAAFARQVLELQELSHEGVSALLKRVVGVTRFDDELGMSRSEADQQNWGNVQELVSTAVEYEKRSALRDEPATLEGFLESTVLVSDADQVDPEAGSVMLMTLHAAKGLEFPVVFIVGLEKGLIPFERAPRREEIDEDLFMNSSVALEEERRLLFVGMTRACEELYLTQARRRLRQGSYLSSVPSDFLAEMPLEFGSSFEGELFGLENAAASPGLRHSSPGRDPARILDRSENRHGAPPLLTTAAALLAGRSGEPKRTPFEVGMQVRHPRMGLGRVLRVGESAYGTVTVEFDRGETVDFVTRGAWCPLQPVGTD